MDAKYSASDIAKWFIVHNRVKMADNDADYISNLKLQKLLYYAQGVVLAATNIPLFREDLLAWTHGPVVREVYDEYKEYGSRGIDGEDICLDLTQIDDTTQELLCEVYDVFGQYSAWKLRNMTHEETPWQNTPRNGVISLDLIKTYFKEHYVS